MSEYSIPVTDLTRQLTMKISISGIRAWEVRMKIGEWLIRLAANIMAMNLDLDVKGKAE